MNNTSLLNHFNLKVKEGKPFQGKISAIVITIAAIVILASAAFTILAVSNSGADEKTAVSLSPNPELLQARRYTLTSVQKPLEAPVVNPEVLQARRYTIISARKQVASQAVNWQELQARRYTIVLAQEPATASQDVDWEALQVRRYIIQRP
jgi:hypothetical protein